MMCQFSVVESKSATFPTEKPRHLLDDSVLEPHSPARGPALTNGLSLGGVCVGADVPAPLSQCPGNSQRYAQVGNQEAR